MGHRALDGVGRSRRGIHIVERRSGLAPARQILRLLRGFVHDLPGLLRRAGGSEDLQGEAEEEGLRFDYEASSQRG